LIALATTVVLRGSALGEIRVSLDGFAPVELASLRLSVASIALTLIAGLRRVERSAAGDAPRLAGAIADAGLDATAAAVYLGIGPSVVGCRTWAYAVARVDVSFGSTALYCVPGFAFATGCIFGADVPSPVALAGALVTIGAVRLTATSQRWIGASR
jgi:drug/metabolite transporter (DMT)-like permease